MLLGSSRLSEQPPHPVFDEGSNLWLLTGWAARWRVARREQCAGAAGSSVACATASRHTAQASDDFDRTTARDDLRARRRGARRRLQPLIKAGAKPAVGRTCPARPKRARADAAPRRSLLNGAATLRQIPTPAALLRVVEGGTGALSGSPCCEGASADTSIRFAKRPPLRCPVQPVRQRAHRRGARGARGCRAARDGVCPSVR
jgi:hypothetical protein